MKNCIHALGVLLTCVFIFSCASNAYDSYTAEPVLSNREFNEVSRRDAGELPENRMIAYSASLLLSVKNIEEKKNILIEQIGIYNGFIIRETENTVAARIPSENMDYYLNFAKTLGKIENETKTGTDITDQYRDNILSLDNLKNVRNRYLSLLEKANTVSEILSIERELERVNLEIERLEGRILYAVQSVAYSNITVRFRETARPGPVGWVFYGLYHGIKWLFIWD